MADWKGWEVQLLNRMGYAPTKSNLTFLRAWHTAEQGVATYNPLNTTWGMPGAGYLPGNSAGVRMYTSPEQGLSATIKTLRGNKGYAPILAGLAAGNVNPAELARRVAASPWGTKNFPSLGVSGGGGGGTPAGSPAQGSGSSGSRISGWNIPFGHPGRDFANAVINAFGQPQGAARTQGILGAVTGLTAGRAAMQPTPIMSPADAVFPGSGAASGTSDYKPVKGTLAEAFYDPIGQWDQGKFSTKGIGGHSDHVHLSVTDPQAMLSAIKKAQAMGLRVGENPYVGGVDPVHVKGSYHYRNFPGQYGGRQLGEGIDVSGDPAKMAGFFRWSMAHLR